VSITATGYTPRTQAEILQELIDELRSVISDKLDLSEKSVLGNYINILAPKIAALEDLNAEAYDAFDVDNASDDRFVALCLLSGIERRGATTGLADVTLTLQASKSYAASDLVAHVQDEPGNRWENRDAVASTTAGSYAAVFISQTAAATARAPAGTLTVIADPVDGWDAITNAQDGTPGIDIEAIEALRVRREQGVAASASRTRGGIRAAIVDLDGVLSCEVFENTSLLTDADGIPGKSIRVVVWDGTPNAADDDEIADAIYARKAEGILAVGAETGIAQDPELGPVGISFDRATESVTTVAVVIESTEGVAIADVKAAILAAFPGGGVGLVGEGVVFNKLAGSVFAVKGVDDWTTFTINGGTAYLAAVQSTIRTLAAGSITVTGDAI
jgi:uncharacterized phage protein gp47/JayE